MPDSSVDESTLHDQNESSLSERPENSSADKNWLFTGTDLYDAVRSNALDQVDLILASGVDVNTVFTLLDESDFLAEGKCALHVAIEANSPAMVQSLIQQKADVDKASTSGETPLHLACKLCRPTLVEMLLTHGADVNSCHAQIGGDTPLITAVSCYQQVLPSAEAYLSICQALLQAGADINKAEGMGLAPLHIAATKTDNRLTKLLLQWGADPNAQGRYVMTPLMRAMEQQREANVVAILAHPGCDVNAVSSSGHTALSLCVETNHLGLLLDLMRCKPHVYGSSPENCPLHHAASHNYLLVLRLLLAHGGYVNTTYCLDKASLLVTLARKCSLTGVDMLLKLGADPNLETRLGTSALWAATRKGHIDIVRLLLEYNCDLESLSLELMIFRPLTPVQVAIELGHWQIARLLLAAGCELRQAWLSARNLPRHTRRSEEISELEEEWLRQPRCLQQICRAVIRQRLGHRIHRKLARLRCPIRMQDFILMRIV